tara:strand:- start:153 stop:788 length:636 start_codon:yes stop_codon:yes gene_type:complete
MTSVLATKGSNTPLLSEHIAELHLANDQDEERRYEALEYCFMDIMTCFSREFLQSMDSVNGTRLIFVRQVRDFRSLVNKFPYFTTDEGVEVPIISPNSYESLISVLAEADAISERKEGKKTSRFINGKEVEIDPHAMMKQAGYDIDEGLGLDLKETLEDLGLLEVVEEMHVPKKVLATSALMGTAKSEAPRSIFLDGHNSYNPNITIGGLF